MKGNSVNLIDVAEFNGAGAGAGIGMDGGEVLTDLLSVGGDLFSIGQPRWILIHEIDTLNGGGRCTEDLGIDVFRKC